MKRLGSEELRVKAAELHKLVRHAGLTYLPLKSDVDFSIQQWRSNPSSQFWCRTSIRCACAAIEARLFAFRKMAEKLSLLSGEKFNSKELEVLSEKRIVEQNGGKVIKPKYLPFPDSVKESFKLFGKASGATIQVDYGPGFKNLCDTFEIRNRLMHPKTPFDVQISLQDIHTADKGFIWFEKAWASVFEQVHAHFQKEIDRLKNC